MLTLLSPLHQSADLWGHKWSCEPLGPALAQMCYWTGASVFSMWQNELLGSFRLLRLRAFYSMNTLIRFDKDTVLTKPSDFCFYPLMKAFISTSWIFRPLIQIRDERMRAFFYNCIYMYICISIYMYTHIYIQVRVCVYVLLCGKLSKYKATEPMPPFLFLF